jgi:hypothetical protein
MKTTKHTLIGINTTQLMVAFAGVLLVTANAAQADVADKVEKVLQRATQARDKAAAAKENAGEIRDRIREAAQNLAGDVKNAVTEAVQDVSDRITVEIAEKQAFESQHCEQFRDDLISTLENLQAVDDMVKAMISPCQTQSEGPTPLIDLLEQAPCGVLYPLFTVQIDFCPLMELSETVDAMQVIHELTGGLNQAEELALGFVDTVHSANQDAQVFAARLNASRTYLENHEVLANASKKIKTMSRLLEKLGSRMKAKGEKNNSEASVGIHGYAHVKFSSNHKKEMGENIQSLAKMLKKVADYVDKKTDDAEELSTANVYLTNQATIIANQEAILAALAEQE